MTLIEYLYDLETSNNRFYEISDIEIIKTKFSEIELVSVEYKALKKSTIEIIGSNIWTSYQSYALISIGLYKSLRREDLINNICLNS